MKARGQPDDPRAHAFVEKASRLIRWTSQSLHELKVHGSRGRADDVERLFFSVLALLASLHEAIDAAALRWRLEDFRADLNALRLNDPLLFYLWKARDVDVHDAVLRWDTNMRAMQITVTDGEKATAELAGAPTDPNENDPILPLWLYAFEVTNKAQLLERIHRGHRPTEERLKQAGLKLDYSIQSIQLQQFKCRLNGKQHIVSPPLQHLGNRVIPGAHYAADRAILFYQGRLAELSRRATVDK
jgi:hypothetical protein